MCLEFNDSDEASYGAAGTIIKGAIDSSKGFYYELNKIPIGL